LAELRAELDRIDDAIHDLLQRRAEVVEKVASQGGKGRVPIRPGREANIVRRLLARHHSKLPKRLLVRWWRELFAATTSMQGSYVVAVCETEAGSPHVQAAREHFGALTPLRAHRTPAQAIAEVSAKVKSRVFFIFHLHTAARLAGRFTKSATLAQQKPKEGNHTKAELSMSSEDTLFF
jgi:chorismate mutase